MSYTNETLVKQYLSYIDDTCSYKISYNENMTMAEVNAILSLRYSVEEISKIQAEFLKFAKNYQSYTTSSSNPQQSKQQPNSSTYSHYKTTTKTFVLSLSK